MWYRVSILVPEAVLKMPGVRSLKKSPCYRVNGVVVFRYLDSVEAAKKVPVSGESQRKVISMSLWGAKPRYTYGALRNAQLLPVYFPGWTLRFYVERPHNDDTTMYSPAPPRILGKLSIMGAEIVYVDAERSHVPPMMWRFLIADDMSVDAFIVRDSDCRLNDRDFAVVSEWLRTDFAFHCIRDHPSHAGYSLLGGLWGGRPRQLRSFVSVPWRDMMMGYRSDYVQDMQFLANAIWPLVQSRAAYCHDSVSCREWLGAHPFPIARIGTEHLGQVFDAFGNARDEDLQILLEHQPHPECLVPSNSATRMAVHADTNEADISAAVITENDKQGDSVFAVTAESTYDEHILYSRNGDAAVLHHLKNTSSSADNRVLSQNAATETDDPSLKELIILPLVSHQVTRLSSHDSEINSNDNQVFSYPSVHVNRTFAVSDGS